MVEDSLRLGVPIAVGNVLSMDEGRRDFIGEQERQHQVGQTLSFVNEIVGYGVPTIIERTEDGSMVIFLKGLGKARLGKVLGGTPYIICEAEKLEENHEMSPSCTESFFMAQKVMIQWMNNHIQDPYARSQFLTYVRTPEQVVGCYASYLLADHDIQQLILECDDINEKINLISRLIASGELVA